MGYGATKPQIMAHLVANPGKPITVENIATATKFDVKQIQHQMQRLIKEGQPIQVVTRGRIWVFNPVTETASESDTPIGQLWECIGVSKKGNPILKNEDGVLYIAKELDI